MEETIPIPVEAVKNTRNAAGHRGIKNNTMAEKNLIAKALILADILDYQHSAIVSREIIKKDTGTVTLFAFDKAQGLSEHTAPFDALVYIVDGRAEITISDKSSVVKKGEMIIMPANKPHAIKAVEKFKMLLIMIRA